MNSCGWQMVGPSVFQDTQVIPKWLVLQYFQKSRFYQNGSWFSISRKAGYTQMLGPSVFPDSQVENPVLRPQMDFLGLIIIIKSQILRWIPVVDSSWTLKSQIPAMNSCGGQMVGPSVFPDTQVIPKWLVLQYSQIHRSYQNAWSFSISRFRGPQNAWSSAAQKYKFRHPKHKFRHQKYKFRHPKQAI